MGLHPLPPLPEHTHLLSPYNIVLLFQTLSLSFFPFLYVTFLFLTLSSFFFMLHFLTLLPFFCYILLSNSFFLPSSLCNIFSFKLILFFLSFSSCSFSLFNSFFFFMLHFLFQTLSFLFFM